MKTTYHIPYGKGTQPITIEKIKASLSPKEREMDVSLEAETNRVKKSLQNPINSPTLQTLAQGKNKVLIITSDHTRPVPSHITMPLLLEEIRKGSPQAQIHILLATGMHRPTTEEEMIERFGEEIAQKEVIMNHFSQKDEDMVFKGILPSGGELWLNNQIDWADLIISEGFIEPHFFAGFSGGRKSILPGIASHKTVLYNHNSVFIADPHSTQGNLENNPLHVDMTYAAQVAKLAFILNVRLDGDKKVIAAYSGDPFAAHLQGCNHCLRDNSVEKTLGDIVITSNGGYPLDQNIYQAVKGMSAGAQCLKEKGVLIMAAACNHGHGGEDFYQWFKQAKGPQEVADKIAAIPPNQTLSDQWEAQILARVLLKGKCIFVTEEKNRQMIEDMHMTYAPTLDKALEMAYRLVKKNPEVVLIPNGADVIVK